VITRDLSPEAVRRMVRTDLANVTEEPEGPVEDFEFNGCLVGIGCFTGRPPWERHNEGDELLHILDGESRLTILDDDGPVERTIRAGDLVVVPRGRWHNNDAPAGVTMLYITPAEGSDHSWERPRA
jgi:quercetin dioxygenase-like cupin family protein